MSRQWYDRHDMAAMRHAQAEQLAALRAVVLELCAALVRIDRNGYQQRLLDRTYAAAGVTSEQVAEYNRARAERTAAKRAQA